MLLVQSDEQLTVYSIEWPPSILLDEGSFLVG